ncbi:MAG: peptidoglycan editing factor PgeF [Erysipelotrichaceae bacterium]
MKYITWKNTPDIISGTSLRDTSYLENFNLALHVGGNLDDIINNRIEFSKKLGIKLNDWVFAQQTHSDICIKVSVSDKGRGALDYSTSIPLADALYTTDANVMLGVFHADCVPVLLYDPTLHLVCAIHSGWLGTVKEITLKTVNMLIAKEGVNPNNLLAYIGPAIGFNNFEVDTDVITQVKAMSIDTADYINYRPNSTKAYVDTKGLNKAQLIAAGVPATSIDVDSNDTFSNDKLFSYRRDHSCGRHITFIMLK